MKTRICMAALAMAAIVASCGSDECPKGFYSISGSCVDLLSDRENCGGWGVACGPGFICQNGTCVLTCPEGHTDCSGVCRDLLSDFYNCGSCGMICAPGSVCVDGSCAPDCPEGYTNCSGVCKNLSNDPTNCGDCGNACAAGEVCSAGTCTFACPGDYVDCSGSCVDVMTDHRHCGACDDPCLGAQICVAGECETSCPSGFVNCSGACRDPQVDHENCGACGRPCATDEICSSGVCVANCASGFTDCSGSCRDVNSDRFHCGACDNECADGEVCNSGTCEVTCPTYLTNCSGVCSDTTMDPDNCGSCGTECGLREACISGTCTAVIILGPSLTEVRDAVAVSYTYMTSTPYSSKHDGGMVYSIDQNAFYAFYGNDNSGRNVYRIDHHADTYSLVATLTYGRHGAHPVIDDDGGYIYFPPSQNTAVLERMVIGGSHTVTTLATAPRNGTFAHGTFKNGKLWIILDDNNLYSYDPSTNTWTMIRSYGNKGMVIAHGNDASDNVYVWVVGGTFHAYDTVAATNTTLTSFTTTASLGGNGQIEYIPSAEGLSMGFIYAVSGCSGSPRIYSIRDDAWYTLTYPHDNGNCNGHCTFDTLAMRLYVTDASNVVWYYQY